MEDLIIQALDEAVVVLESNLPQWKIDVVQVDIDDVTPVNLAQFMKDNNIPDTAYFGLYEGGGFGRALEVCLYYQVDIPLTEQEKLKVRRNRFNHVSFKYVHDVLIKNGYNRAGCWSNQYSEFGNTCVYDMYINKHFDRLVKYYSLAFQKQDL
jgi:hypothetical protein